MQHYFLSIQNLFDMLVNIKIKQKKTGHKGPSFRSTWYI
jgi:hypothetical protein